MPIIHTRAKWSHKFQIFRPELINPTNPKYSYPRYEIAQIPNIQTRATRSHKYQIFKPALRDPTNTKYSYPRYEIPQIPNIHTRATRSHKYQIFKPALSDPPKSMETCIRLHDYVPQQTVIFICPQHIRFTTSNQVYESKAKSVTATGELYTPDLFYFYFF